MSACNGHLEVVKVLLERGADVHAVNSEGQTPYQEPPANGYKETADSGFTPETWYRWNKYNVRLERFYVSLRAYTSILARKKE